MAKRTKIGPNKPCPCGSRRKYKKCCKDTVDWPSLLSQPLSASVPFLSARGKNLAFINLAAGALQLDAESASSLGNFKRAFTTDAVRQIYEIVDFLWPSTEDLDRVLKMEARDLSGLYVGMYEPELVMLGLTRHSLYANTLLLVDPLMCSRGVRDEYNPILHPDMYRKSTLKWVWLWFSMVPWIEAGIVRFIKTPGDLDTALEFQAMDITRERYKAHPELEPKEEDNPDLFSMQLARFEQDYLLNLPDEYIRRSYREMKPDAGDEEVNKLIDSIQRRRDADPFFLETIDKHEEGELEILKSGASYEMAKLTASITGSFLITDIPSRWREIAHDRKTLGVDSRKWSPFAKAFHELEFKYLNNVPLRAALDVRQKGRLEDLRRFLGRTWRDSATDDEFDERNVLELREELQHHVGEAEEEWKKINRDLLQWLGAEFAAGALGAAPAIAAGGAEWLGVGTVAAGITTMVVSGQKRAEYLRRYPAALFARLSAGKYA